MVVSAWVASQHGIKKLNISQLRHHELVSFGAHCQQGMEAARTTLSGHCHEYVGQACSTCVASTIKSIYVLRAYPMISTLAILQLLP